MIRFQGQVWRIHPRDADPCLPVCSPEGRFHHSGQTALYASLTPEGCVIAIRRYLRPDDPPRVITPLSLHIDRAQDLRGRSEVSMVWQDLRKHGQPSPTWTHSDRAREEGAQALLYSSRSRPDVSHLALVSAPDTLIRTIGTSVAADAFLQLLA